MRVRTGRNEVLDLGPTDARRGDPRKSEREKAEDARDRHLRNKFGLSPAQYQEMLKAQGEVCAICRQPERVTRRGRVRRLSVDHDHRTGAVRGLLCQTCNATVGLLRDDPEWAAAFVRMMAQYLARSTATAR